MILNEGEWQENTRYTYPDGNPKQDFIIKVNHNGDEKLFRLNKTNRDNLIGAWGNDTSSWVNKKARVEKMKALVSGKQMDIIIL